jgi:hypothetical protein
LKVKVTTKTTEVAKTDNPVETDLLVYEMLVRNLPETKIRKYAADKNIENIDLHLDNARKIHVLQANVSEINFFAQQMNIMDDLYAKCYADANWKECRAILDNKKQLYITYINLISVINK